MVEAAVNAKIAKAPKKRSSKSDDAYEWIRERILDRQYTPGYRLVLSSIADSLDMSVVPVREAVRKLEAEGLVTFEKNVGACVKMIDESQYANSMQTLAIIEGAATALSAPYLTPKQVGVARSINQEMRDLIDNFDARTFTSLNQEFHSALLVANPNDRLMELVRAEWTQLGNLRESTFSFVPKRALQSVREHDAILELIESGAPKSAIEQAVRSHRLATVDAYLIRESNKKNVPFEPLS